MPVIDLDLPCRLVESGTPGHYHLYIDKAVSFTSYDATVQRGYGSVRHPDRPKQVAA